MIFSIIKQSFLNQKKAMALIVLSVAVGTAIATSLLALSMDISSKVSKELRAFGANILVEPRLGGLAGLSEQERFLFEEDIVKIKTIFWRHNVLGMVPFLYKKDGSTGITIAGTWYEKPVRIPGEKEPFVTGISRVMPWWQIRGRWPADTGEVALGAGLAAKLKKGVGEGISLLGKEFRVVGIVNSGGKEDEMVVMDLDSLQSVSGLEGKVSRVYVSALTTPMDEFAYKDPEKMTRAEYEKWYCTGYVTSIAKQVEEVMRGSVARPIWPVAETEGKVLNRLKILIYLLTVMALLGAALGVSTTMVMSLLRRTHEVALMKAIGADRIKTIMIFLSEALLLGFAGGLVGYLSSFLLTKFIGYKVFGTGLEQRAILLPVSMLSSILIVVMGAYLPIRKALGIRPAIVLKGE
ncbi:MAG: ABC transporter permease [Nitrospirae bacterium]|nr:MAG: ABC transporter permease [Nitrospirota bacterium]